MKNYQKKYCSVFYFLLNIIIVTAQNIPEHISYTRIYDFLDELTNEKIIDVNSAIKPYSRQFIAKKLQEAQANEKKLNKRQQNELYFFLEDYALEQNRLPDYDLPIEDNRTWRIDMLPPSFHYHDSLFRVKLMPILGMNILYNSNDKITQRWYGFDFQSMIGNHLAVYASLRDVSQKGELLAEPTYLTPYQAGAYKRTNNGGDYSEMRGGISYAWKWGDVALVKDHIQWGNNYHGSNIFSGRTPSFPMLKLGLKPAKWLEINYFHGWLTSNVIDSTRYYLSNQNEKMYRYTNKFLAANLITFTPISQLHLSAGNSIVYAESNVQPAYLIPIAFYKSMDHTLTMGTENQNSQLFFDISSRNIKHLHLFTSVFIDEFSVARLKASNKEKNPVSYKLGFRLSNFPLANFSLTGEWTRNEILVYKHSIPALTWATNGFNLGNYLGDNSQEIYVALQYKPLRGLDINLSYSQAEHGNEYAYIRHGTWQGSKASVLDIISEPFMKDKIWSNKTLSFDVKYEISPNIYAILNIENSNIQAFEAASEVAFGEKRMTAEEVLNFYTPKFLQGKQTTITAGLSFGF
ncbi:MAG TPA: hypothetical protein PLE52_05645 [Paludibacteraceae bacterium]|nr:hypothetical protein [Paludibacteraceae bacterium]